MTKRSRKALSGSAASRARASSSVVGRSATLYSSVRSTARTAAVAVDELQRQGGQLVDAVGHTAQVQPLQDEDVVAL